MPKPKPRLSDLDRLLLRQLGEEDAIWLPHRAAQWSSYAPRNVAQARQAFAGSGLPCRSDAASVTERVRFMRLLEAAADEGRLTVRRPRNSLWPHVRLTDAGELHARSLAGLSLPSDAALLVAELPSRPHYSGSLDDGGGWVSERDLASPDLAGDKAELRAIECMALPALSRGWLESGSDIEGRVYYRLGAVPVPAELPQEPADLYDPEVRQVYEDHLRWALDRLESTPPTDNREIGPIPLPVSMGRPVLPS